jgi:hypothetical protein
MPPLKYITKLPVFMSVLLLAFALPSGATGAVINLPLRQFILTNTSADGSIYVANDGLSFVLTGGNTGSGQPGITDFTVSAQNAVTVEFFYSYASLDLPGFDAAGYVVGSTRVPLTDTNGTSGVGSFSAGSGQTYGWYVSTADNAGEPGILTVTFTPTASAVPEPAGFLFVLTGISVFSVNRRLLIRTRYCKERNT